MRVFFFLPYEELLPYQGRLQSVELIARYGPFPIFCLVTFVLLMFRVLWHIGSLSNVRTSLIKLPSFMRVRKIAKCDYQLCDICSSVHIEQLRSHWTNFHQIWYLSIFRKSLEKIQVSLKSGKNNGYFWWRHVQGGSNITGTDLCVNKPHCAAAVRTWESEATTSTLPPARVRTCSVLSGSC